MEKERKFERKNPEDRNQFGEMLKGYIGRDVEITIGNGSVISGVLLAVSWNMNIILKTKDGEEVTIRGGWVRQMRA